MVVGVEQVVALEERLDPVAGGDVDLDVAGLALVEGDLDRSASVRPSTSMRSWSVGGAAAGVGDGGPDVEAAARGARRRGG